MGIAALPSAFIAFANEITPFFLRTEIFEGIAKQEPQRIRLVQHLEVEHENTHAHKARNLDIFRLQLYL